MLPAGTRCPASSSASVNSRSIRSKPCMRRLSQLIERKAGKHARTSGLFQQAPSPVVDDAAGVQLVQEDVHVALLTGAGQHEPVTTFLDRYEQVAGTGQRRHLLEQRVDLLALLLPGLIAYPVL